MPATVGESGSDNELALVVESGGLGGGKYCPEPLLEVAPAPARRLVLQKLMFDFLLELCLSNVFCAEKGLGLIK